VEFYLEKGGKRTKRGSIYTAFTETTESATSHIHAALPLNEKNTLDIYNAQRIEPTECKTFLLKII